MERWAEGKLVADDVDVAYEPEDKDGKKLAAKITLYLNLLMWRVKMDKTTPVHTQPYGRGTRPMSEHQNCRCVIRPIDPQK